AFFVGATLFENGVSAKTGQRTYVVSVSDSQVNESSSVVPSAANSRAESDGSRSKPGGVSTVWKAPGASVPLRTMDDALLLSLSTRPVRSCAVEPVFFSSTQSAPPFSEISLILTRLVAPRQAVAFEASREPATSRNGPVPSGQRA